ncbi:MAG: hypothetical protein HUU20_07060 [Pirellulales bacterium]|nr:hypothetical protein [Pirellulales bacterium]
MRCFLAALGLVAAGLAGCVRDYYEVEMRSDGKAIQRTLTCWREEAGNQPKIVPVSQEQVNRLRQVYKSEPQVEDGKYVFRGKFVGTMPADVGGAGTFTRFASPLGDVTVYLERFRGEDDLEAALARRRGAADELADLVLGWLRAELGSQPGWDRLEKFLDRDFRADLKNLAIYSWTAQAAGDKPEATAEFVARIGQYLYERQYFTPEQLPELLRAAQGPDPQSLLRLVQRHLARRMGIGPDQPVPACLEFLSGPDRASASWSEYLRTTPVFGKRLEAWKQDKRREPGAEPPKPEDMTGEILVTAFAHLDVFSGGDSLSVKFQSSERPLETNGAWDESAGAVQWSASLRERRALPVVCFALWTSADGKFQEDHFGKVVVKGRELAQYVMWYRGLTPEEILEWDRLISGCQPWQDLAKRIGNFRFSHEPPPDTQEPDEATPSLADLPKRLILEDIGEGRRP